MTFLGPPYVIPPQYVYHDLKWSLKNPTPYGPLNFDRVILRDIFGAKSFLKYNSKHGYSKSDKEMACKSKEINMNQEMAKN